MCESCVFYAYECITEVYESLARGWGAHTTTELCVPPYGGDRRDYMRNQARLFSEETPYFLCISYSHTHTHKRTLLYVKDQTSILRVEESRTGWRSVASTDPDVTHTRVHTHTHTHTHARTHTHTLSHSLSLSHIRHPPQPLPMTHTVELFPPSISLWPLYSSFLSALPHLLLPAYPPPIYRLYHPILHYMASYSFLKNTSHFLNVLLNSFLMYYFILFIIIFWRINTFIHQRCVKLI